MPVWNRLCRHRRNVQRKRTVTRAKTPVHQGIRPEERTAGSHFLRRNERVLRLWIGSGRSHQRNDHSSRHAVSVAGPASTGRSLVGWIYHEFHLVRCAQYSQSHGLPVSQFRNPAKPALGSATRNSHRRSGRRDGEGQRFAEGGTQARPDVDELYIFSNRWGIALREWNGTGRRTKILVALSLFVLILSTVVVGYGNYVGIANESK